MKKEQAVTFSLDFYERKEMHNVPTLIKQKDSYELKYEHNHCEIKTHELGMELINFLNLDFNNKIDVIKYITDTYSVIVLKGIYEQKEKKEFKLNFKDKKEYGKYIIQVIDVCYDELAQAQNFFKDYLNKTYDYNKQTKYTNSEREMRELIYLQDKTTDLKLYNKYEKYIQSSIMVWNGRENVDNILSLTTDKAFYCIASDNIIAILYTLLKFLTKYKSFNINRCNYCSDYFLPISRSDEKFCSKVYADGTKCRVLGVRDNWKSILEADEVRKLYNNTYQKKLMYCKRNPQDTQAKEEFENWKKQVKENMKKYKRGEIDREEIKDLTLQNFMQEN